jgi:hypothetical protein
MVRSFQIVKSAVGFVTLTDPDVTPFPRIVTRCHAQCVTAIAGQAKNKNLTFLADVLILPYKPDGMHAYSYFPLFQKNEHKFRQVL